MRLNRNARTLLAVTIILLGLYLLSGGRIEAGDKVTICHAAGQEGTTQFTTLELPPVAVFGQAGHFNEDGTPRAGHEEDYLGPCSPSTPSPGVSQTPSPTPTSTSTAAPSATPTITPTPRPTPVTSGTPTQPGSTSPATTSPQPTSATLPPTDGDDASSGTTRAESTLWALIVIFTATFVSFSAAASARKNRRNR